ncbi:MAG TPA: nitroreductase family protein [Oligoflexia bacterium]|nr:nitroreductase family protein [Oligoflexia bacterium]
MEALTAISTRRSIRKYTGQPLTEDTLLEIVRAGMAAPSAFDERPWHFVLIQEKGTLSKLASAMEHCEMLREAGAGLLICGDEALEKAQGMQIWVQDCSACAENILLAAHALGLGAVWLAIYPIAERSSAVRKALQIPQEISPFALISLGYPAEQLGAEDRYDANRVHREQW